MTRSLAVTLLLALAGAACSSIFDAPSTNTQWAQRTGGNPALPPATPSAAGITNGSGGGNGSGPSGGDADASNSSNPPSVDAGPAPVPFVVRAPAIPSDAFSTLKDPAGAHAELCANDGQHPHFPDDADLITKTFCQDLKSGGVIPQPQNIADLQKQLGLDFKNPQGANGAGGNPAFVLTGHSSSLVARLVSAINPRAIVFTPPPDDGSKPVGYAILAFTRGEQFAEVAVHDPTVDAVNLYLVFFDLPCNAAATGCTKGDLLTPRVESGFSNVRVYESSTALNDTIADCKQCHQPDATGPQILRMQELTPPFTHFFSQTTTGGAALLADFHAAHGFTEDYGPIPASMIDKSDPNKLAKMVVQAGFGNQPNAFDSAGIELEVARSAADQPTINVPSGKSLTWQRIYDNAAGGSFIATPYHDVKVTDPTKLHTMSDIYQRTIGGLLPVEQLPDIRQVFLDSAARDMSFAPREGADGRTIIDQICTQCHNSHLDQTLTRARFNAENLESMSRQEKDLAIQRIGAGDDSRLLMPPLLFRSLSGDEQQKVIGELSK